MYQNYRSVTLFEELMRERNLRQACSNLARHWGFGQGVKAQKTDKYLSTQTTHFSTRWAGHSSINKERSNELSFNATKVKCRVKYPSNNPIVHFSLRQRMILFHIQFQYSNWQFSSQLKVHEMKPVIDIYPPNVSDHHAHAGKYRIKVDRRT